MTPAPAREQPRPTGHLVVRIFVAAEVVIAAVALGGALLAGGGVDHPAALVATVVAVLLVGGALLLLFRQRLDGLVTGWVDAARTDPLTGLANRRELEQRLAAELERSTRSGRPLAILALDLDWFKDFNDRFGQAAGDGALARVAEALQQATRTSDVVARTGGQEFAVIAPETDLEEAALLAERLRDEVRSAFARDPETLTISCGVSAFPIHGVAPAELLQAADRALREAKQLGRDRIAIRATAPSVERAIAGVGDERRSPRLASLMSLADAVDRRLGTPGHSQRVASLTSRLAVSMSVPQEETERMSLAALLRDVGEVGLAESVIGKQAPLSDEEWREVRQHPEIGARIVGAAQLGRAAEWIRAHHERPDGRGYPRGLFGHQIPLPARILSVADAYAAMTAERPHRPALSRSRARAELRAGAGSQFDHDVVEAFLALPDEAGDAYESDASLPASSTK